MQDDSYWVDRCQSAEARLNTLQQAQDRIKEDAVFILDTFAARKKSDGSFDIDYQKFIENIGEESAMELIDIIYEQYVDKLKTVQ